MLIDKRVYKGDIDTPKGRKGKPVVRTVAISSGTVRESAVWREMLPSQSRIVFFSPTEKRYPAEQGQRLEPAHGTSLEKVGLKWATFQFCAGRTPNFPARHHRRQGRGRPAGPWV